LADSVAVAAQVVYEVLFESVPLIVLVMLNHQGERDNVYLATLSTSAMAIMNSLFKFTYWPYHAVMEFGYRHIGRGLHVDYDSNWACKSCGKRNNGPHPRCRGRVGSSASSGSASSVGSGSDGSARGGSARGTLCAELRPEWKRYTQNTAAQNTAVAAGAAAAAAAARSISLGGHPHRTSDNGTNDNSSPSNMEVGRDSELAASGVAISSSNLAMELSRLNPKACVADEAAGVPSSELSGPLSSQTTYDV
jgi:hypothetical protein